MNPFTLSNIMPQEIMHLFYWLQHLSLGDMLLYGLAVIGSFRVFNFGMKVLL